MAAPAGEVSHPRPRRRGHRPVPLRGPPLVAGHDRMKGSANAAWNGAVKPSGPIKKYGDRVKNRRGGAPGGARAGEQRHAAPPSGARLLPKRRPALRSLAHARGKKKEAPPRASLTIGVDGARPYVGAAPWRCLTCESVLRAGAPPALPCSGRRCDISHTGPTLPLRIARRSILRRSSNHRTE